MILYYDGQSGYNHFCKIPHCNHSNCGNCVLFTDTVADDRMAMKEAGLKVCLVLYFDVLTLSGFVQVVACTSVLVMHVCVCAMCEAQRFII